MSEPRRKPKAMSDSEQESKSGKITGRPSIKRPFEFTEHSAKCVMRALSDVTGPLFDESNCDPKMYKRIKEDVEDSLGNILLKHVTDLEPSVREAMSSRLSHMVTDALSDCVVDLHDTFYSDGKTDYEVLRCQLEVDGKVVKDDIPLEDIQSKQIRILSIIEPQFAQYSKVEIEFILHSLDGSFDSKFRAFTLSESASLTGVFNLGMSQRESSWVGCLSEVQLDFTDANHCKMIIHLNLSQ